MLNKQVLDLLLETRVSENAVTFIIYSNEVTERLAFSCGFIFRTVLKVNYINTNDLAEFKSSNYLKINYSDETLPGIAQVIPHQLMFEKGISESKPQPFFKDEMIYFYDSGKRENNEIFSFDIFSSVFYFISRYEEWQVFKKDGHQRFEANASILFPEKFHLKPVVDLWIQEFKFFLQAAYAELKFPLIQFQVIGTLDIDNLFAYKNKGALRTAAACMKDILKMDFRNLSDRINVVRGKTKDPFDIYESIAEFFSDQKIPLVCFFLFRTGTLYDRTVNPRSEAFKNVFEILKKRRVQIGLHPSYDSAFDKERLKMECGLISEKNGEAVRISRQHFLRFDIRTTPNLLFENGIKIDSTMGFASSPGFRAGTSHPFYYFDFSKEKRSSLLFLPFCAMDGAYFAYDKKSPEETFNSMFALALEIKKVGGYFVTVYHERTFSNHLYPGFGTLYKNLHLRLKEI